MKEEQEEFRARNAAAVKRSWKDPEFRARNAAATKRVRYEPLQAAAEGH